LRLQRKDRSFIGTAGIALPTLLQLRNGIGQLDSQSASQVIRLRNTSVKLREAEILSNRMKPIIG
jgi:hypothetical protein